MSKNEVEPSLIDLDQFDSWYQMTPVRVSQQFQNGINTHLASVLKVFDGITWFFVVLTWI